MLIYLRTGFSTIHDCVASKNGKRILHPIQPFLGFFVPGIDNPSIRLHQSSRTEIFIAVPPVRWAWRRATGTENAFVKSILKQKFFNQNDIELEAISAIPICLCPWRFANTAQSLARVHYSFAARAESIYTDYKNYSYQEPNPLQHTYEVKDKFWIYYSKNRFCWCMLEYWHLLYSSHRIHRFPPCRSDET